MKSRSLTSSQISQQQIWHSYSYFPHFTVKETKAEKLTFSKATQPENSKIQAQPQVFPTTGLGFLTTAPRGCCNSLFISKSCSSALAASVSECPICPLAGILQLFIQESLFPTTCLDHYILYFTSSARLNSSQHLSLGLFSCLHAYDQIIFEASLPPICCLLLSL